jgi:polyisoprenoid-binding protein YceI
MSNTITETREALPTGTWNIDPVHSQVSFAVDYLVGAFEGSFSPVDAKLEVDENGRASLTGSAPVAGVHVKDENLEAHLQSPDFFDAERAPEITFASTEIRRSGDEISVDGELSIRGVALPVQLEGTISGPADHPFGGVRLGLKLETTIDRTQFGVNWNAPLPTGGQALANEVALAAQLFLVQA